MAPRKHIDDLAPDIVLVAEAMLHLIEHVEQGRITTIWGVTPCPKCAMDTRELRQGKNFIKVMMFCPACFYFEIYDLNGDRKRFIRTGHPTPCPRLPRKPSPDRPLERSIKNHLKRIGQE